jgi:Tfp pilus assembly protein PilF
MKARLLGEQRRWPEAIAIAQSLKLRFPVEPRALASAAQIFSDAGDFAQAMGTIDRAIQLNNNLYMLWDQRAEIRRSDDYVGRQSDLETALRLAPGDLGLVTKLGLAAFDQGKWSDARDRFTQVIDQEPKDFGLLAYRALAFLKLDALGDASNDYKAALAVASGPGDLSRICGVFAREGIATDWALATCDNAVTAQPDRPYFRVNRGLARLRANDVAGARSDFDIAIAKDANSSEAYYGRAVTSLRAGDRAGAVKDRQTALSIDPNVDEYFIAHRISDLRPIM